jgi:hypothetical protein
LDTRRKIISLWQAQVLLESGTWTVVVGLFDPLTAVQALRIKGDEHSKTLAVVLESPDTLLPAEARCHLVAALRSVDFVALAAEHDWRSIAFQNPHVRVIDDLGAEKRRSEEFIERIISRQQDAAVMTGQNS